MLKYYKRAFVLIPWKHTEKANENTGDDEKNP